MSSPLATHSHSPPSRPVPPRPIQTSFPYRQTAQPMPSSSSYAGTTAVASTNLPSFSALMSSITRKSDDSLYGFRRADKKSIGSEEEGKEVIKGVKGMEISADEEMGLSGLDLLGRAAEEMFKFDTRPKMVPMEEGDEEREEEAVDKMDVDAVREIGQGRRGSGCTSTSTSSASLHTPSNIQASTPRSLHSNKPSLQINTQLPPHPPLLPAASVQPSSTIAIAPKSAALRGVQSAMAAQLLGSQNRAGPYPKSYRRGGGSWGGNGAGRGVSIRTFVQPRPDPEVAEVQILRDVRSGPQPGKPVTIGLGSAWPEGVDPMMRGLCVDELPLATPFVFEDLAAANRRNSHARQMPPSPLQPWNPPRTLGARISEINQKALGVQHDQSVRISRPGRAHRKAGIRRLPIVPTPIKIPGRAHALSEVERAEVKMEVDGTPTPVARGSIAIPTLYPAVQVKQEEDSPVRESSVGRPQSVSASSASSNTPSTGKPTQRIQISPIVTSGPNKTYSIPLAQVKWIMEKGGADKSNTITKAFLSRPSARYKKSVAPSGKGNAVEDVVPGVKTIGTGGAKRNVVAYRSPSVLPLPAPPIPSDERGNPNGRREIREGVRGGGTRSLEGTRKGKGKEVVWSSSTEHAVHPSKGIRSGGYSPTERTTFDEGRLGDNASESPSPAKTWATLAAEREEGPREVGGQLMTALSDGSDGTKKRKEWEGSSEEGGGKRRRAA